MSDTNNLSKQLGMQPLAKLSPELRYGIQSHLACESDARFSNLMIRSDENGTLIVGDVFYHLDRVGSSNHSSKSRKHSFVYTERAGLGLPSLTIQPKSVASNVFSMFGGMTGLSTVQLNDHPEASKKLTARSMQPQTSRQLLSSDVLDSLIGEPPYTLKTHKYRMLITRNDEVIPADDLVEFVGDAVRVFHNVAKRAEELPNLEDEAFNEALEKIQSMPGPIGAMYRSQLVPKDVVEEFLAAEIPREVPTEIRRQILGYESILFYIVGIVLIFVGGFVTWALWDMPNVPRIGAIAPSFVIPIGLTMIVLTSTYRSRKKRLLTRGMICEATIESVQQTNVIINNRRRFKVELNVDDEQEPDSVTVNAYQPGVEKAFELKSSGEKTRVLIDPRDPRRAFWIDSMTIV